MIQGQNDKTVLFFCEEITNAETVSGYVDTQDYDYAVIECLVGTSNATSNNFTTLKLSDGPDTTGFTALATFTGDDTTDGFTIPNADTSDPQVVVRMNVRLDVRRRYLKLEAAALTTQAIAAFAHLSRADETPTSASDMGVGAVATG